LIQRVYTMKSSNNNNTFSKDDPNRPVVLLKFSVQKDLKQNENGFAHDSDLEMNQEPFVNKLSPNSKRKSNGKERKSLKSSYQWNGASIDSSKFDQPFIFGNSEILFSILFYFILFASLSTFFFSKKKNSRWRRRLAFIISRNR